MRRILSAADQATLKEELEQLPKLDLPALRDRWDSLYKVHPPRCPSNAFLIQAIAYRLQEQALGGLRPLMQKTLDRIVEEVRAGKKELALAPVTRVKPGVRLLRTWRGDTHEVTILDKGVLFRNERYRSLTEVAKLITGQHWSGPEFFGIGRSRKKANGQ